MLLVSGWGPTYTHTHADRHTHTLDTWWRMQTHKQLTIRFLLTSRRSRLMKLAIANPSMMSSSCELDSRLFRRGGRETLAAAAGCGAFLPGREAASLPGLCPSLSEQEELGSGLRASLLPASRNLRTLSRLDRHLRPCFSFPSMLSENSPRVRKKQQYYSTARAISNNTRARTHTQTHTPDWGS